MIVSFFSFWVKMINLIKVTFPMNARPKLGFHFLEEQVVQAIALDARLLSLSSFNLVAM